MNWLNKYPNRKFLNDRIICINADCLDVMKDMEEKSVDLVLTDPPYFKIKKEKWDNQWKTIQDFQKWTGIVGNKFYRIMKDNSSLYWFGDDKNVAYCQVELDKKFNLLNNIVWYKCNNLTQKGIYRSYTNMTERILFYDKFNQKTGLEKIKEIMPNPFAEYLKSELLRKFKTIAKIRKFIVNILKMDSAMWNRWIEGSSIITKEKYLQIREYLNNEYLRKEYKELRKEYEYLRKEYEELRKEYEYLRRCWNNDIKAYDVLKFNICQDKGRFHPTQKPLNLIGYLLNRSSKKDFLIFDAFAGSFTTAISCIRTNRRCICVELDKNYYELGCNRIETELKQGDLFRKNFNKNT